MRARGARVRKDRPRGRPSKYHNRRVAYDGYVFDSMAEMHRYQQLVAAQEDGRISDLQVHPRFEVLEEFEDAQGTKVRPITYMADFSYRQDGRTIVEDVKGVETKEFKLKEKLFRYRFRGQQNIELRVLPVDSMAT